MTKKYKRLPPKMIVKVKDLFDKISPEDIDVDFLDDYKGEGDKEYANLSDFKKIGSEYLYAQDLCLNNSKVCAAFQEEAKRILSKEESLAFLDRAVQAYGALKKEKMEITDGKAGSYVNIDEKVNQLRQLHSSWGILKDYFFSYYRLFEKKHDWVKTMIYMEAKMDGNRGAT